MSKDLTNSAIHRQNILNNSYALQEIEKATHITGIQFEEKTVVLKEQAATFFEVSLRTVESSYPNSNPNWHTMVTKLSRVTV